MECEETGTKRMKVRNRSIDMTKIYTEIFK